MLVRYLGIIFALISVQLHATPSYVSGELLIKYRDNARLLIISSLAAQTHELGGGVEKIILNPEVSVETAMLTLKSAPEVLLVQPNYIKYSQTLPNDPLLGGQWGLHNTGQEIPVISGGNVTGIADADIDMHAAWGVTTGSSSVVVAVLDSGIDYTHPDLSPNIWQNTGEIAGDSIDNDGNGYVDDVMGWDFVHGDNDPVDLNGHGTHVAGVIAARGNNNSTVTGVSWNSSLMPLQVTEADGVTTSAAIVSAIYYAVDNGAKIINASYGETAFDSLEYDAINYANSMGVTVVAAACNDGRDIDVTPCYPASYDLPNIITVAASDQFDNRAVFSSWGAASVDLAAPGVSIISTFPQYTSVWSTNFTAGQQGWTFGGDQNQWEISAGLLTDSPNGTYANNANAWAMSPAIDLSNQSSCRVVMGFDSIVLENNIDKLYVEGSSDGSTWRQAGELRGFGQLTNNLFYADVSEFNGASLFHFRLRLASNESIAHEGVVVNSAAIECYGVHDETSYVFWSGTSVAAPHVSGTAALLLSQFPTLTVAELRNRILDNVDVIATLSSFTSSGGRLNAARALGVTEPDSISSGSSSGGGGGGSIYFAILIFLAVIFARSCICTTRNNKL